MHGIEEWPLIDEYGMDISPSSYTKVAITEVSLISFQIQSLTIFIEILSEYHKCFISSFILDKIGKAKVPASIQLHPILEHNWLS